MRRIDQVGMRGSGVPLEVLPQRQVDGTHILRIRGEIDLSNCHLFERSLLELFDDSARRVIVDLTECEFIDSRGLRALLAARGRPPVNPSQTPRLLVCGARGQVRRMLEMTGVDFEIPILRGTHEPVARAP